MGWRQKGNYEQSTYLQFVSSRLSQASSNEYNLIASILIEIYCQVFNMYVILFLHIYEALERMVGIRK